MAGANDGSGLHEALAMEVSESADVAGDPEHPDGVPVDGEVHDGWDVFGIPHGGYLAALAARSVLLVSGQPDLFTVTVHYLRKAAVGPVRFQVRRLGASRRFTSWQTSAVQDGQVVLTALASVGDRDGIEGPEWTDAPPVAQDGHRYSPPAGDPTAPFPTPAVAQRFGQRIALDTAGFAAGRRGEQAMLRTLATVDPPDQLAALVACDLSPPAVWNVLGSQGWVPTVELTAHVRNRPAAGLFSIEAVTHHVGGGFLEEDAVVRDAAGTLVVQSRQLARWTAT